MLGTTGSGTVGSLWESVVDLAEVDDVLEWPPDLFALIDLALDASEAYRFVVSPPEGVALAGIGADAAAVAAEWWRTLDTMSGIAPPRLVAELWQVVHDGMAVSLEELSVGGRWPVIEALLALYTIADETCAGLGPALAVTPGPGCRFRAGARELFAARGSLSRLSTSVLRVIPRCRGSAGGISVGSLARHVSVQGPQVDVDWHRMPSRPTGVTAPEAHAYVLLLPWPLRVRARDFQPVPYELANMDHTEFGFFAFAPEEPLDLDRVEGVLRAAIDEGGTVDIVALPECAVVPADIEPLESLLERYGAWCLIAGVREPAVDGRLGTNWVHVGVRQEMVWRHARQHKHHRWCLDGRQIGQYHLGGALSPAMRWWEAVAVPRRSLQVIDQGVVNIATLVCEDLARLEPVAELVRSIGPSLVVTLLLDGPQLASRWTARYASVLADDPGSAVCTLTSFGMVRRCRPPGCEPSRVVALWKDASGELTEIELDDGADAVLIATTLTHTRSITADGRRHDPAPSLTLAAVQPLRALELAEQPPAPLPVGPSVDGARRRLPELDEVEVSKATSWVEAVAEAAFAGPDAVAEVLDAAVDEGWRTRLGLRVPTRMFVGAIDAVRRELPPQPTPCDVMAAARRLHGSADPAAAVSGLLLEIALEQRVFTEVTAGRCSPDLLASLSPRPVNTDGAAGVSSPPTSVFEVVPAQVSEHAAR